MMSTTTKPGYTDCGLARQLCWIFVVWLGALQSTPPSNQIRADDRRVFRTSERLNLGTEANRSASVRIADVDNNNHPDVIVANGRHWPQQNFVFLNLGRAALNIQRPLGDERRTSYATESADLDGDGDIDIAVGNDMAPNHILFNDGRGQFKAGSTFGKPSSVRSLLVVDIDRDGDVDILATCRGRTNRIYLNDGTGHFGPGRPFGQERDSTIDVAVVDWNNDEHLDLVLANRDAQQNAILLNDGNTNFNDEILFGQPGENTRAVAVAELTNDDYPDIVVGNISQRNRIYSGNGRGGFAATIDFGSENSRTYALTIADLNNDNDLDLIVGNVDQENSVFFNNGDGSNFSEVHFGSETTATYGLDTGDLNGDGFADIAVANSGDQNSVFLNLPAKYSGATGGKPPNRTRTRESSTDTTDSTSSTDWPSFRGINARGVAEQQHIRTKWNADEATGKISGVLWSVRVPGLGHSSPVVVGDRIFLATAVAVDGKAPLAVGKGGQPNAADDNGEQSWVILCYDRRTGIELWRQTAHRGTPRATRHAKATHANTSVTVDGNNVVAFLGSEGLYCYDLEGRPKWKRDLGVINISKYGIGWGYASSPTIHNDQITVVCDDPEGPFIAAFHLSNGKELWRTSRKGICERSWGTPFIHTTASRSQAVINGWPWVVSYDMKSGKEFWRIRGGGDNPVPTPFAANGLFYITSAHGAQSPIFVVRPDATGDISPSKNKESNKSIVWSTQRGGSYMSTPVVYKDYLYLGNTNGAIRCFNANTGEKMYEKRLDSGASITASLVAARGHIYCASENGSVYVLEASPSFNVVAQNRMGQPCFATPAIADGVIFIRTTERLIAIK